MSSRFCFPGFAHTRNADTSNHEVVVGIIKSGEDVLIATLIRNKFLSHLPFLIAKIESRGRTWNFKDEHYGGVGRLAMADDTPVVALATTGRDSKVERVIPLSHLFVRSPLDLRLTARMKRAAAEFLGIGHYLSTVEQNLLKAEAARQAEELEAARKAAAERRNAERERRIRTMLARGYHLGYTADGRTRRGIPVLETEWMSLSNGTSVILVESIGEDGTVGRFIEAFTVRKERSGNPRKDYAVTVTTEKPASSSVTTTAIQPSGAAAIEVEGGVFEVQLYSSMDVIRAARAAGLNGGTYVAVDPADAAATKLEVFAVHHDRIDTIGLCERLC